jgi:hypothetical protein
MNTQTPSPAAGAERSYAWLHDGDVAPTLDDRIAEAIALAALVFSLGVGLVIALLPVAGGPVQRLSPPSHEWAGDTAAQVLPAHADRNRTLRVSAK